MAAIQTWTLWQRMPPRYQLTSRYLEEYTDETLSTAGDRAMSGSMPSSRPQSSIAKSPRQKTPPATHRESFMLSTQRPDASNEHAQHMTTASATLPQKPSFPKRNSDYLNHIQQQKRVNSARRRLAECPSHSNDKFMSSASPRAQTAPVFPVTSPDVCKERKVSYRNITSPQTTSRESVASARSSAKAPNEATKVDMFQFDDSKSVSSANYSRRSPDREPPKPKKYHVQDTEKSTLYIDNGKVICFGKSRHDLTQLLKTQSLRRDRNSCFLAELRRDYLNHPKYDNAKLGKRNEEDPRRIAHERVDYNQRVQHILSYYSDGNAPDDTRIGQNGQIPMSRPNSAVRASSPSVGRRKGLVLTGAMSSRALSPSQERDSSSDFMKLNKKSKLHQRQFYLRTPGMRHDLNITELEKCRCSMCRMELQLALVTSVTGGLELQTTGSMSRDRLLATNIDDMSIQTVHDIQTIPAEGKTVTGSHQRVQFQEPDVTSVVKERKIINCKLPEVGDAVVSESGVESARTQDCVSVMG